uniref:Uncharacterized protein n=1 Tax=Oryza rufipogon TaxID=4529 RepID=A0A0E0N9Q2_ORYRU
MRRSDDKIVGGAILYDPAEHAVRVLPSMVEYKFWTQSFAVGDDLYVMETGQRARLGVHPQLRRMLVRHGERRVEKAGDWALPFRGRAEYVPEHGLWYGLSAADDGVLGAWDLSASTVAQPQPPPAAHPGCGVFEVPEPEAPYGTNVVHLGGGKLCVAKLYMVARPGTCSCPCCVGEEDMMKFAMLTGVEVARGGRGGDLSIVKHKSLRRIDTSRLFYPKDQLPRASPSSSSAAAAVEDARLPPAAMGFSASMNFMRTSDDKIVTVDDTGRRAILYDPAAHTVRSLPPMASPKFLTVSLAVAGDLYVMVTPPHPDKVGGGEGRRPEYSFEALVHRERRSGWMTNADEEARHWRPMPPPPFVHDAAAGEIHGYAAIGDSHILVSTDRATYSFDTASAAWSKAGDWRLPFRGRAEHVPEHGLCVGFLEMDDTVLAAWDVSASPQPRAPAASVQSKGFSVASPGEWKGLAAPREVASHVVHLGGGKLCVAKVFWVVRRGTCSYPCCVGEHDKVKFAMLTGVEVVPGGGHGGKPRIVKHKSVRH